MHPMGKRKGVTMLVIVVAVAMPADAMADVVDTFTDPSAFAGLSVFDFDGEAGGSIVGPTGTTLSGTHTDATMSDIFFVDPSYHSTVSGPLALGVASSLLNADGTDFVSSEGDHGFGIAPSITIDFNGPGYPTAIGMHVGKLLEDSTSNLTITFSFERTSDGTSFSPLTPLTDGDVTGGFAFRGFTFDEPISSMSIELEDHLLIGDGTANALGMDNFYFGSSSDITLVPAPGAAILAVMGFGTLAWSRRRLS